MKGGGLRGEEARRSLLAGLSSGVGRAGQKKTRQAEMKDQTDIKESFQQGKRGILRLKRKQEL